MTGNISCYVQGCNEPVIGQCPGHQQGCGRFHCQKHSYGHLCVECGHKRAIDEHQRTVHEDYQRTAQKIGARSSDAGCFIFFLLLCLGVFGVAGILDPSLDARFKAFLPEHLSLFQFRVVLSAAMISFLAWLCWLIVLRPNRRIARIERTKPGFKKFYKAWRKQELARAAQVSASSHKARRYGFTDLFGEIFEVGPEARHRRMQEDIRDIRDKLNRG